MLRDSNNPRRCILDTVRSPAGPRAESPQVRRRAAWALGEIEDDAALAHLERALRTVQWAIRQIDDDRR